MIRLSDDVYLDAALIKSIEVDRAQIFCRFSVLVRLHESASICFGGHFDFESGDSEGCERARRDARERAAEIAAEVREEQVPWAK